MITRSAIDSAVSGSLARVSDGSTILRVRVEIVTSIRLCESTRETSLSSLDRPIEWNESRDGVCTHAVRHGVTRWTTGVTITIRALRNTIDWLGTGSLKSTAIVGILFFTDFSSVRRWICHVKKTKEYEISKRRERGTHPHRIPICTVVTVRGVGRSAVADRADVISARSGGISGGLAIRKRLTVLSRCTSDEEI
jgi:hypothetical protein